MEVEGAGSGFGGFFRDMLEQNKIAEVYSFRHNKMSRLVGMSHRIGYLCYHGRWVKMLELCTITRYRGPTGCCIRIRKE